MKILLVDVAVTGHRYQYMKALMTCCNAEFVIAAPERMDFDCRQHTIETATGDERTFSAYRQWIRAVRDIARQEKPDLIHFLYGDGFYKYFGYGVSGIPCKRKITTMHFVRRGQLQELSLKVLSRNFEAVIVHSEYLKDEINRAGVRNAMHIEYPHFNEVRDSDGTEKAYFGLDNGKKVIACLGGTRSDKGLDILLEALNHVDTDFQLLIAGKPMDFDEAYILQHIEKYRDAVSLFLKYLSDEELDKALLAADIVCLPYKKSFNGASGPLGEGVSYGKCIIGADHGNLGRTIEDHHLGYVFHTESSDDLARVIDQALAENFTPDEKYREYQEAINLQTFKNRYSELYNR